MSEEQTIKKNSKKTAFILICVLAVMVLIFGIAMYAFSSSSERRLHQQLDLGYKYLEELNYEQAIAAFEAAIEIDPRNVDCYLGLAEAYSGHGDAEGLIYVVNLASDNLGDENAEEIKQSVISMIETMIANAISEDDWVHANELIDILNQIAPDVADKYSITDDSITDLNNADFDSEDEISDEPKPVLIRQTQIAGDNVIVSTYTYDDNGRRIKAESLPMNSTSVFEWSDDGRVCRVAGSNGWIYTRYLNESGFAERVEYSDGSWTDYELDDNGNVISSQSSDGTHSVVEPIVVVDGIYREIVVTIYRDDQVSSHYESYDCRGNWVSYELLGDIIYYENEYSDGVILTTDHPDV